MVMAKNCSETSELLPLGNRFLCSASLKKFSCCASVCEFEAKDKARSFMTCTNSASCSVDYYDYEPLKILYYSVKKWCVDLLRHSFLGF